MAQALLRSVKMFAAGMATAFLSRKPVFSARFALPEPRVQPFDRASGDLDGFLFGGADEALRAHVTRHQTAMGALSDMMVRLRSVVSDLAPHAPIVVEGRRAADLGGDWSRFDETIFDVEHVATADCAIRVPVDPPAAHAFMFDADTNPSIPVAFVAPMMREGAPL